MIYFGTTLNGKYPVATSQELSGRGIKKVTNEKSEILEYKGEIIKGLYKYFITAKAFSKLKETNDTVWAYGI